MKTDGDLTKILTDHLKKRIGNKLHAARLEKNYTIKAVAHDVGIGEGTLSEIEHGIYNFKIETIAALADYYGASLIEFLSPPL